MRTVRNYAYVLRVIEQSDGIQVESLRFGGCEAHTFQHAALAAAIEASELAHDAGGPIDVELVGLCECGTGRVIQ